MPSLRSLLPFLLPLLVLGAGAPEGALAHPGHEEPPAGPHHLFRPVPRSAMRPLSTDRPDRTESAYTLDAGHFQVEIDALAWARDRSGGVRRDGFGVGAANLKLGLTDRADLQLVVEGWNHERAEFPGLPRTTRSGLGDLSGRLKINLFGNDGGRAALAAMPFVALPTAQRDLGREHAEAGLIVPLALDLPRGWGVGAMAEADVTLAAGGGVVWIASATASHDLVGPLAGYVELYGAWPDTGEPATGTFDLGLTWGVGPDLQLDGGANLGLNSHAEDVTLFLGVSVRR